jgi:hypothetical protein
LRATEEPEPDAIDDDARRPHDGHPTVTADRVSRESPDERATSAQAGLPKVESGDDTASLTERTEALCACLLRSWPWVEGVRVADVFAAWKADDDERQFPDLWRTLRELTDTTDGSIPSPHKIGNALRWMRGHTFDGATLSRERDRSSKIATWHIVRKM